MGSGSVNKTDFESEYGRALQEIKELAKEYDESVPEPLKERLKQKVKYAYSQLEMNPDIPKHKRVPKLMDDLAVTLNIVIPKTTLYRWIEVKEDDDKNSQMEQKDSSIYCSRCSKVKSGPVYHTEEELKAENAQWIQVAQKQRAFWESVEKKCGEQHIASLIPADIQEEGLYLMNKSADNNSEEWDGRQDVSERRFPDLVKATLAAADKATELFIKKVKEWKSLTGKQYSKLIDGKATNCHAMYEPQTEDEAFEIGFQGSPCVFLKCLDCEKEQEEELRRMRQNGEQHASESKVNINSRADAEKCRRCGGSNLVKQGCGKRRLMFGTDSIPALFVKCAFCHETFPPLSRKLPTHPDVVMESAMATHRR